MIFKRGGVAGHLTGAIGPLATGQTTYPALTYTWSANGQPTQIARGTSTTQANLSGVTVLEQSNIVYDALGAGRARRAWLPAGRPGRSPNGPTTTPTAWCARRCG